jgi:molybdopterin molybdotransferase
VIAGPLSKLKSAQNIPMLLPQEADRRILSHTQPFTTADTETIALDQCQGRILAAPITSHLDFPHWDNSAMDGYAVRFEDVKTAPVTLTIGESIPAGKAPAITLQPGQAARILTGSMLPIGADTVVMQEHTDRDGDQITILEAPKPEQFVRKQGVYYQAGAPLLPAGITLNAAEIAILAAAQCVEVPVFRRVKVAILSTGSELVEPHQPLQPGQIVDSNQYALAALVQQMGAEVMALGVVSDRPERLKVAMQAAIDQADIVISSGGVSVGDYDFVDRLLEELGATIHVRSVAVKPGKPLTFATLGSKLYFGLPGNPVSAMVTFWRFVRPAIGKRSGLQAGWELAWLNAIATQTLKSDGKRESYLWGQLHFNQGQPEFHLAAGSQLSGNLINLAGVNALAVVPIGVTQIQTHETIQLLRL